MIYANLSSQYSIVGSKIDFLFLAVICTRRARIGLGKSIILTMMTFGYEHSF